MKYNQLIIEENEFVKLEKLLNLKNVEHSKTAKIHILKLQEELRNASIVPESEVPKDVIRLNSMVTVSTKDGNWSKTFELVLPSDGNIANSKISLLMPMGTAVIGYAKGDAIFWDFPAGKQELKVLDVKQSEKTAK